MNLIIVTCPKLALTRLPRQISQMSRAITRGLISDLHIICMDDSEARDQVKATYKSGEWNNDIAEGWESFRKNMLAQIDHDVSDTNRLIHRLTAHACFPE